jgi:hypothetical protein
VPPIPTANIAEYPANCMKDVSDTDETNAKVMEWLLRGKYASADGLAPDLLRCQLKVDGLALSAASLELKNNRSIVQQAVKENGLALQFASHELRSDKNIVLKAVRCSGGALEFASNDLRADSEVVLESVYDCGSALEFASEELRGDEAVVIAAIRNYGGALEFASEKLRGDRTIVLEAVRSCALSLEYASEPLKADRLIIFLTVGKGIHMCFRSILAPELFGAESLCWKLLPKMDWLSALPQRSCAQMAPLFWKSPARQSSVKPTN